ncbi:FMNH2-utilizing oxygenase [Pseudonocardia sp. Ae168_Ps1]|nr:FMNH2-utilizing oxygenase [Pseudonocardia sp. Ae150A_Ps1]OLL78944.1 FMNH2-utilizing oxygenase [Pseudonocardia sp. Ae168_Ps1]OLL86918.1 FMNH2-utilizing oxygenase [Pseudonocardia sp. Ae263_Ps1]OLL93037.1 FMNH2-utilizing oxygenase [Pseudonocardia sp. Ae356_Ps1]
MHLAVELGAAGRHPGAWRSTGADPDRLLTAEHHVDVVRTAARGGLDLVALPDSLQPPSDDPAALPGTLDAVAIAARVAPAVPGIGVVPTATVTHTEPFHLSKAVATLDFVATGRAGWQPDVSRTRAEADLFGRTGPEEPATLWREAGEVIDVVARLWDSWEDDAEIRDAPTGRFVDRDRLHHIDFAGEFFSVKGPSITPRPPQGRPLTVLRGDETAALPVVGRHADAGRDPGTVPVLLDVETLLGPDAADRLRELDALAPAGADLGPATLRHVGDPAGLAALLRDAAEERAADGFVLAPLALPSGAGEIVDGLLPALGDVWSPAPCDGSLRERFGLSRPANRYATR